MAIFDTEKDFILTFYIVLTDPAAVASYQALYPDGVNRGPIHAAVEFGAPWKGISAGTNLGPAPYSYTDWTAGSGKPYPTDVAVFTRHTGGAFGIGGTTVRYLWMGKFVLAASATGNGNTPTPVNAATPAYYWVEGFETPSQTPLVTGLEAALMSPDASRHVGGRGLGIRGQSNAKVTISYLDYNAAATNVTEVWERFYVRLRRKPSQTIVFWRNSTSPSAGIGQHLGVTADGGLAIYTSSAGGTLTLVTVVPDVQLEEWDGTAGHDVWAKIDLLYFTDPAVPTGGFKLYINGELKSSAGGIPSGITKFLNSSIGGIASVTGADLHLDVDDWTCAAWPKIAGVQSLTSKDIINGTRVSLIKPRTFSANHSGWTGDVRVLAQNAGGFSPAELSSSTSGATAAVDTDATDIIQSDPKSIGLVALLVVAYTKRGAGLSGALGYKLGAAAAVTSPVTQGTTYAAQGVIYSSASGQDGTALADRTPIELRFVKGADAIAGNIAMLHGQAALAGKWNKCDYLPSELALVDAPTITGTGPHNFPYPQTPWASMGAAAPVSPYLIVGGTYVGNGAGIDLNFRIPPHFLLIRPLTGNTGGFFWLAPAYGSHAGYQEGATPHIAVVEQDPTFASGTGDDVQTMRFRARLAGNGSQINALGVTYQYIAICDPGMRYLLTGVVASAAGIGARDQPLITDLWEPGWAFVLLEGNNSTTTRRLYGKGPGNAAATLVNFQPATLANALTFGAGKITTDNALHALNPAVYALARRSDGSQDTSEASALCFGSYIGDGSASRTINLTPATGKRPMFAMFFAESGTSGYHRDPSHTGSNSSTHTGAENTTGITSGGIDQVNVGSSLNANGVTYSYFVLFGDATSCNNGWGCNGEYPPVEPFPTPGPWPTPTPNPGPSPGPNPEPVPNPCSADDPDCIGTELSLECKAGTTGVINRALGRLGVSKVIADASTDNSLERSMGVMFYGSAVTRTLRDFPWPFATKWNRMVPLAGSTADPVNAEWTYAYRLPGDCVFPRRICSSRGGAVDPTPQPFELSQQELTTIDGVPWLMAIGDIEATPAADLNAGILYTNQAAAYLEYTARPRCAASATDALFREALEWQLAAMMAAPLTRMADRAKQCLEEYQRALREADVVVRPGKPGLPSSTVDADAATKKAIINRGLIRIGARQISDYLTDDSREAQAARAVFDAEYRSTLADFPWTFATAYATPTVTGDGVTRVNADWYYSAPIPADALFVRRLVTPSGRGWDPNPYEFRLGLGVLFTNVADPTLEYTALVDIDLTDDLFKDALAWRLAASLAPSLASVDPDVPEQLGRGPDPDSHSDPKPGRGRSSAQRQSIRQRIASEAWAMYRATLLQAKAGNANQSQPAKDGDASWIEGR